MKAARKIPEKPVSLILIIIYLVGIAGSAMPVTREYFFILTPYILLLSFIILLICHSSRVEKKTILAFLSIFLVSYCVEVAGVSSGIIFGPYIYGKGLGIKLLNTPLIIGLNWLLLIYCTYVIADKLRGGILSKILYGSALMVLYDLIMEQVAPSMDMWTFEGGAAPVRNYISWFLLAMLFHFIFRKLDIKITNRIAPLIFLCQGGLFISLFIIFTLTE